MNVWLKRFLSTIAVLAVILFSLVSPIDRTPLSDQSFYQEMNAQLDSLQFEKSKDKTALYAGWKKVAITPDHPMPMAGYLIRDNFEAVHDSLYARIIVLNAGGKPCYLISVDLLLFPPTLKQKLIEHFSKKEIQPF